MTTIDTTVAQQALDALELANRTSYSESNCIKFSEAIKSIRAAIAQPVPADAEQQSCRDANDMPTERAVLEREWRAMRVALALPSHVANALRQAQSALRGLSFKDRKITAALEALEAAIAQPAAVGAVEQDAMRYRFLRSEAYESVIPHGNTINGSRTAWITKLHPGANFDQAIDAVIAAKGAQPVQPTRKALSDAELCVLLVEIDPETKRLPSGFRRFARAIEDAHGIWTQE